MDASDPQSMEAFADHAWNAFGGVHLLINNAGISIGRSRVTDTPLEDLHKLFDVNFFGVWHGVASFGRRMVEQGETAAIYNLGSENSFFTAVPQSAAYVASKHAVRGLTEAMREDFPDFITLGMICPGFVKSEMTPPPFGDMAMDTDDFAKRVIAQIKAGEFYIVTHAYNIERIKHIHDQIEQSYARNAERYDGDEEYDVRTLIQRFAAQRAT